MRTFLRDGRALLAALLPALVPALLAALLAAICLSPVSSTAAQSPGQSPGQSSGQSSGRSSGPGSDTRVLGRTAIPAPTTKHHYIANVRKPQAAAALGFNVIDTGTSEGQVDALPAGTQGMVWLGQKCPKRIDRAFRKVVKQLGSNPKVYGYFLSDEPHIGDCPRGPAHLKARARYIHQVSGGRQKAFIVLSFTVPRSYHAFRPAASGVDLIGIDPYPCSVVNPSCLYSKIRTRVHQAIHAGISRRQIVPSFQAFGQERVHGVEGGSYYHLPTGYQMKRMLQLWARLVPHPRLDFTYGWDHQPSSNPTLVNSDVLQRVFSSYFRG